MMPKLDHINIHVTDGPRMVRFLEAVLGAEEGFRPPFEFPGHWVYVGGEPAIHLTVVKRDHDYPEGLINHIAFGVYDFEETRARIEKSGYSYRLTGIPETGIGQFFVEGPEGLLVEVQYRRLAMRVFTQATCQRRRYPSQFTGQLDFVMSRSRAIAIAAEQKARQGQLILAAGLLLLPAALLLLLISP